MGKIFALRVESEELAMDFPIADLMDEDTCYAKLWPGSTPTAWPARGAGRATTCTSTAAIAPPRSTTVARPAGGVFNAYTDTALHGTKRRPVALVLIVRGFAQGVSTAQLARELR
jgi:hypothetical protein